MKRIANSVLLLTAVVLLAFIPVAFAEEQPELDLAADAKKASGIPPAIPHAVKPEQDGEACNSCHRTGVKKAQPTTHPDRLNCTSCHVQGEVKKGKNTTPKGKMK
jgi:hypothetical protein